MLHKEMKKSKTIWSLIVPLILFVLLNIIVQLIPTSVDLTAEKRYTLTESTERLLRKTKIPVQIKVVLKGNYPAGFRKLGVSTEEILRKFRDIAGPNIQFAFVSPEELVDGSNSRYADSLDALGVSPINLTARVEQGQQQQYIYPVALVSAGEKSEVVELYKGKSPMISHHELYASQVMLEYALANGISKVTQEKKPVVGYLIGNGEPMDERVYDLIEKNLNKSCELRLINLNNQPFIHPSFDAVVIIKPNVPFTDFQKLTIDQYIQHGGNVIFSIDKLEAEMDSLQLNNQVIAYEPNDRQLGIPDLLCRYGVRLNTDLLMDLQCDYLPFDVNGNGQYELLPWNYFPVLESSENHPINKNLGFVVGRFTNTLDTITTNDDIKKTILLWSSVNSRTISSPVKITGEENSIAPEDEKFKSRHLPAAILLEGNFSSYFARRLSQVFADSLQKLGMPFLSTCEKPASLMVVADGDVFLNDVTKEGPLPMGVNQYTMGSAYAFPFANRELLINTLEYFINRDNLIEAKSKEVVPRLLDMKRIRTDNNHILFFNILLPFLLTLLFAFVLLNLRSRRYQQIKHA